MKTLCFLLLAARLLAAQTPEQTWGQWQYRQQNYGPLHTTLSVNQIDPHWQIAGWGPVPNAVCTGLRDVWIMPDGSYRYCVNGSYANPFTAVQLGLATASADGLLSKTDFVTVRALQSAAFQPVSAFDPSGSAATAQAAAISQAAAQAAAAISALQLKSASQHAATDFDAAGAALSAQTTAVSTAQTNTSNAIAALGLKSASQQLSSAFEPAGAAAAAVAALPLSARSGSYLDLLNKPILFSGSYLDLTNKPSIPAAQVQSDWSASSGVTAILNKPTIPASPVNADWSAVSGLAQILNKPALGTAAAQNVSAFDAAGAAAAAVAGLPLAARSGSYSDLSNKPSIPAAQVQSDWSAATGLGVILNKPTIPAAQVQSDWNASLGLAAILNKPTIPTNNNQLSNGSGYITAVQVPAQVQSDWNASSGLAQILNKPTLGTAASQPTSAFDAAGAASSAVAAIPTATAAATGLLSKTDWTTFNSKQNSLGFTPLNPANNLSELTSSAATARTNLGLGSSATQASSAFDAAGAATAAQSASLQKSSNLADLASVAAARTNLGLGSAALANTSAFDTAGAAAGLLSSPNTWSGLNNFGPITAASGAVNFGLPSASNTADLWLGGGNSWARAFRVYNNNVASSQRSVFGALGNGTTGVLTYAYFGVADSTNDVTGFDSVKTIRVDTNGNATVQQSLTVNGSAAVSAFKITSAQTPATSSAACTVGTLAWDANYLYVCTAANTWKRSALGAF